MPKIKIPKYKRDRFTFISNLGDITANPLNPSTLKRDGYLLSEHYTDPASIKRALWVRSRRNLLMSDNGNWTRMSRIASQFDHHGEQILEKAKKELTENGEISADTLAERKQLIAKISKVCYEETKHLDISKITQTQLSIKPHYFIGMEDFTIPVLMMCGLLDETFNPEAKEINVFQKRTKDIFSKQYSGAFGYKKELETTAKFVVLHAYDYESAYTGAKTIKDLAKEGIAISYGAPMKSRRWIQRLQFGQQWETFDEKLPEAYLIAQSMTLGAVNGLSDDTPVHILGVGTPILIALTGYLLRKSKAVSIDSTAPFKDAFAGKLYGSRYALLKMNMYRVAALALINKKPYESKTPFFKFFEKKYPSDWNALHEKLGVNESMDYRKLADTLKSNLSLVEQFIPFFTKLRSGNDEMINDLRIARSGHNYWVLKEICNHIKRRKHSEEKLHLWIRNEIEKYQKIGSRKWALAVKKAYETTEKYRKV